ncbi:FG-GAP-like repeat-containing protein [Christiangramia crocea]|uniref:FG-GAP-like repeat-containing protein n=1 Tax=Christiangramia crocea TaxID=2904124 RepID=A0A9X2A8E3_9FLAO|nr:FG-GAP-like repeat-containing protein [Gramella crocea]
MRKKKQVILSAFYLIFFCYSQLAAQDFQRIESYAGLTSAEKNNAVAIADYDRDGDLDLFLVARNKDNERVTSSHSKLFRNNNDGTFSDVTSSSGLINLFPYTENGEVSVALTGIKFGAFWGDYDNDGFPDLFMTHSNKMQLFHNEGDGSFIEVTEEAGFKKYNDCINTDAVWFDYNRDGFLDIYISDWNSDCEGNRLYKNNGNGTFTNVSHIFEGVESKHSYQSIPFDFNKDGWMDLYVANDFVPGPNDLYINNGGTGFTESASSYGLGNSKGDMGMAVGDYNNDGNFDIYITTIGDNALFTKTPDNTYIDRGRDLKIYNAGWAWDVTFSDFDLDRDEDIFVVNGFNYPNAGSGTNVYFENLFANGKNQFINSSQKTNLGEVTISVGAGIFDYDKDGDLDIFVTNNDEPSYFYENTLTDFTNPSGDLHWFKVKLEGTNSNRGAIGTKVSIKTINGSLHRYYSGKGFLSQNLRPVHFGLGSDAEIQELKITWPSGLVETYDDLPVNKTISAIEGNGFTIINEEPSKKIYGCMDPKSCNYNPYAIESTGNCIYLETGHIMGSNVAVKNSIEVYSYQLKEGSSLEWEVIGGEIIEADETGNLKVKWGAGNSGKISLKESNANCTSELLELSISLKDDESQIINHSIARFWNEVLLELIRQDYARPTVHARNLFHTSIAMYDAWAIYNDKASTYLTGKMLHGFESEFKGFETTVNKSEARKQTISFAAYRLLSHRFKHSPNSLVAQEILDEAMYELGYDTSIRAEDYTFGDPVALGNYIAKQIINYGLQDGSNETNDYDNIFYEPVNDPLDLTHPENIEDINPNRWQPLTFESFIDQSGHLIEGQTPGFLGAEWGRVEPFSLEDATKTIHSRSGNEYHVYYDTDAPPSIEDDDYKWAFSLVSKWGSHLDPYDGVLWDISPGSMGNISIDQFPQQYSDYKNFYDEIDGGDLGEGHRINPYTGQAYEEQIVPRGDYTRVLAEFWADGPDSETPPGHWFTILNYVTDHEALEKKINGKGTVLDDLEWDVKAYFLLGGAMHDVAVASWSLKGWYDYIRPISAIRYMCAQGQSSNPSRDNYAPNGIPLKEGLIEIIEEGDPLAGENNENLGKIKLYSWKGHDFIDDPSVDVAGVGWILAETWWPYQRPTFVTPPFAGFVSGHSTFSRAAAEVLTLLTGDKYFPGGMGEFIAKKNEFLVFEEGPSVDITLQWATYQDASDQCSLSRIWGGIHPPIDDILGRIIGEKIGKKAYDHAITYFEGLEKPIKEYPQKLIVYPNPVRSSSPEIFVSNTKLKDEFYLFDLSGRFIETPSVEFNEAGNISKLKLNKSVSRGIYILRINNTSKKILVVDY